MARQQQTNGLPLALSVARWEASHALAGYGIDYAARNVIIMVGRRELTGRGVLAIADGSVVMFEAGDGPVAERLIVAAPATRAEVLSVPRIGLGASLVLSVGQTRYKVMPESTYVGMTFGVRTAIKRARASVAAFQDALDRAKRA